MKIKITVAIALLFMSNNLFSQKNNSTIPKHNYLGFGIGIGKISVFDNLNMGVPYTGINIGSDFNATFTFRNSFLQTENKYYSGNLKPYNSESSKKNIISNYGEKFSLAHYWKLYSTQPSDIYFMGGSNVSIKADLRSNNGEIGNSLLGYNAAASFGVALKAAWYFNIFSENTLENKRFRFEGSFSLPLVSQVFTPPYIGITEKAVTENSGLIDMESNYFGNPSNYFNPELGLSLTFFLPNKNAIIVSYANDYLKTTPNYNPVSSMNQNLSIKLLYNLK